MATTCHATAPMTPAAVTPQAIIENGAASMTRFMQNHASAAINVGAIIARQTAGGASANGSAIDKRREVAAANTSVANCAAAAISAVPT